MLFSDGELLIARSIWNGIATDPKSRNSKAPIPIIGKLGARLVLHRSRQGNPIAGPMFPNEVGKPAHPNNLLQRVILPALNRCECGRADSDHGPKSDHPYKRDYP